MVAGASLGAAAGALLAGPLTDRFGRKALLILDALIYAIGALLSAFTWHVSVLLFARTLIGLAIGADSAIATAYIAEYAPRNRRGSLAMLQQWMITVGILFAYLVALLILKVWPGSSGSDWRWFFGLGAIPAVLGLILRFEMPESPRWLLRHGRYDEVRKAMATLGVKDVSEEDVRNAAEIVERVEGGVGGTGWALQGEVFPTAVRGQAAAFAAMIDWLANFAIIEVFPVTQNAISLGGVMVVFARLAALAIVFIWKFLPETKGLPVEEIVRVFERQQKQSPLSSGPTDASAHAAS